MLDTLNASLINYKETALFYKFAIDSLEDKINDELADRLEDFFFRNGKLDDLNFYSFIKNFKHIF